MDHGPGNDLLPKYHLIPVAEKNKCLEILVVGITIYDSSISFPCTKTVGIESTAYYIIPIHVLVICSSALSDETTN